MLKQFALLLSAAALLATGAPAESTVLAGCPCKKKKEKDSNSQVLAHNEAVPQIEQIEDEQQPLACKDC